MKSLFSRSAIACLALAAGCDPKSDGLEGVAQPTGFAVTSSDYETAAIALLGPDGKLVKKRFVHSGTSFSGLDNPLASDVALPTLAGEAGVLAYIERFKTDQVTRIDIEAGEVLSQLKTQADDSESGFSSNPQDYLYVDNDEAWITRYARNPDSKAKATDKGNDMVLVKPGEGVLTGTRISFDKFNSKATVENPDTGEESEVTINAGPGSMVMMGGKVVVGLSRLSTGFDAIGDGMVAIVDLKAKSATALDLEGLQNCGSVIPVHDDETRAIVSCSGFYRGTPRDTAGLAILHSTGDDIEVETSWLGSKNEDDALAVGGVVSLGGSLVVAVADGEWGVSNDIAYIFDIESGKQKKLLEAGGSFVLGGGYFIGAESTLLLPDASTDDDGVPNAGVRRYVIEAGKVTDTLSTLEVDQALPPRSIRPLF